MVVQQLENRVLPQYLPNIQLYRRYIDDIIVFWKTTTDEATFVDSFNNNPYGLTLEVEQSSPSEVHFLDIGINTLVYHKPGSTSSYIPAVSCDPNTYKSAAFKALIRRAFTHSSNIQAWDTELAYILRVAAQHGKRTGIGTIQGQRSGEDIEQIAITYNTYLKSYTLRLPANSRYVSLLGGVLLFSTSYVMEGTSNPIRRPGIYSIPLKDNRSDRNLIYIDSTKRSLGVRIQEHLADIQHRRTSTTLATYVADHDIVANFSQAILLHDLPPIEHLKWLEAMHIFRSSTSNMCINFKEEILLSLAWQELIHNMI
ncbi:uncharacterized protein LOC111622989 [Centruroides sculpturatus]|uniref:uncharacterized protein LOC111622989 n=1 Tax=Centruroides sculpturatus TaxID=218467 RepID=UPI000C6D2898|nr:uncharacterized protein LOC111622989 [Centruroides sculpturatus]